MSATATEKSVTKEPTDHTFQMRVQRSWLDRVEEAANNLGLSAASYIRMVVSQRMDTDGIPAVKPTPKKPRR